MVFSIIKTINLIFIGKVGIPQQTAGVGLGSVMSASLYGIFGMGFLGASDTLISNSFGKKEYYLCGVILNRS